MRDSWKPPCNIHKHSNPPCQPSQTTTPPLPARTAHPRPCTTRENHDERHLTNKRRAPEQEGFSPYVSIANKRNPQPATPPASLCL
jgi:hypothetical protein